MVSRGASLSVTTCGEIFNACFFSSTVYSVFEFPCVYNPTLRDQSVQLFKAG